MIKLCGVSEHKMLSMDKFSKILDDLKEKFNYDLKHPLIIVIELFE